MSLTLKLPKAVQIRATSPNLTPKGDGFQMGNHDSKDNNDNNNNVKNNCSNNHTNSNSVGSYSFASKTPWSKWGPLKTLGVFSWLNVEYGTSSGAIRHQTETRHLLNTR